MSNRFANGAKSFGFCDRCGFRFDLKKLKNEVIKTKRTAIKSCPQCWSKDHPQLLLGSFPVSDPQALRDPRPDTNTWYSSGLTATGSFGEGSRVIQWGWAPVGGSSGFDAALTPNDLVGRGEVGTVTINPPGGVFINYSAVVTGLLQAAINVNPAKTLFKDTFIGARRLGDINNSGNVDANDSLAYQRYISNISQAASNVTYINTVLNPYMLTNSSTYAAYLIFT